MPQSFSSPSLLARLSRLAAIETHETPAAAAAFALFFFMWAGYFAVRPVRETVGTLIGREQLAHLWIVTAIVSVLIIPLYGVIVARFRRSAFLPWTYAAVTAVLAAIGVALQAGGVHSLIAKFFYVFISVANLFLLSMFWSFLLELFDAGQAKRLFGVIAAGGSAGALTGPLVSDMSVNAIGNGGVLLIGAGFFTVAIFCQRLLLRIWKARPSGLAQDQPLGGALFAGVGLILRSPYLLGIALFIVMISTVNTLLYFEQLRLVEASFAEPTARTRVFARLDWIVQTLTVLSQVFLTGRIARKFGVIALITFVPLLMVVGFAALAISGTFAVLAVVFVLRRACEYAFIRPGREMLWSPLDAETKYKAKNTIDVPVYRGADALAAQLNNAISALGAGSVAMLGVAISAAWAMIGWRLSRRFEQHAARGAAPEARNVRASNS
ncbi:MAG TPA: Npt1/Npt2 family nucleotide transporter [Steroidobacter sp.]|jgi:AAA family ATP:ADP antiporter|nr:Npt1/Npt2 family nucleotide transporter [Steroidobacter sp.]